MVFSRMKSVAIYGYYGHNNAGDDYILLSVINSVSKANIEIIFIFVKDNYYYKYNFPSNVHFVKLSNNKYLRQLQIIKYACKCEGFILGGGDYGQMIQLIRFWQIIYGSDLQKCLIVRSFYME